MTAKQYSQIVLTILAVGMSFILGMRIGEDKSKDENISIQRYTERENYIHYLSSVERAQLYMMYQLHYDQPIDSVFYEKVTDLIWVPRKNEEYITWKGKSPDTLAINLDNAAADWYESICFMWMDEEHDSTWVLNSETYAMSMETVNLLRNRSK